MQVGRVLLGYALSEPNDNTYLNAHPNSGSEAHCDADGDTARDPGRPSSDLGGTRHSDTGLPKVACWIGQQPFEITWILTCLSDCSQDVSPPNERDCLPISLSHLCRRDSC